MAVRTAMDHLIGALPRAHFPASRDFPSRGNKRYEGKTASHILHVPFRRFPPLVPYGTTFPPQFGGAAKGKRLNGQARRLTSPHLEVLCRTSTGDYKAPLCCELLMKGLLFRALFCPRLRGKSGAAGKGGERSEPVSRMVFMSYDTESKSRNVLASPLGEEGHEVAKGVQANWIHRGAPRPANPVRRHPAKSV